MKMQPVLKERSLRPGLKYSLSLIIIIVFFFDAECQKPDTAWTSNKTGSWKTTFSTSRIGLAQSVMTIPKSEFHLVVQHRFGEISANANKFFGLDYAITRLGFEYGLFNWLSASAGRSMSLRTYDIALKALILKQNESNIPLSLSYYFSVMDTTSQYGFPVQQNSFSSHLSFVNQLFIARSQGIFSFQVSPMWLHSNYDIRTAGHLDIFAVDMDTKISLGEKFGIIVEYIPVLTNKEFKNTNPFTIGLDINTGGHQFQVIFSNSQGTNEKAFLSQTAGSWAKGHIYFGFNLTRVFNPRMD